MQNRPAELEQMLDDLKRTAPIYNDYPYWKEYERSFLPFIAKNGRDNFRQRNSPFISAFPAGHTDTGSRGRSLALRYLGGSSRLARRLGVASLQAEAKFYFANWQRDRYLLLKRLDSELQLSKLADSLVGNPDNVFYEDGHPYTLEHLSKFSFYLLMKQHFDFARPGLIVWEIGGMYGALVETLAKLHPQLRFVLIELPTQLYLAQVYLGTVFPGEVVEYSETRDLEKIDTDAFTDRRFLCLLPHQIERLSMNSHLFINTSSFQEMTPRVVAHYLKFVNELTTEMCYLHEIMSGHHAGGPEYDDYARGLQRWTNVVREPNRDTKNVLGEGYEDAIWELA